MDKNSMIFGTNKFFFYAMNYPCVRIEFKSIRGTQEVAYLPDFFKAFPPHIIEHFYSKWDDAYKKVGCYGAIMKFYGELDSSYRVLMLDYIMENYNDEQKIPLKTEEV